MWRLAKPPILRYNYRCGATRLQDTRSYWVGLESIRGLGCAPISSIVERQKKRVTYVPARWHVWPRTSAGVSVNSGRYQWSNRSGAVESSLKPSKTVCNRKVVMRCRNWKRPMPCRQVGHFYWMWWHENGFAFVAGGQWVPVLIVCGCAPCGADVLKRWHIRFGVVKCCQSDQPKLDLHESGKSGNPRFVIVSVKAFWRSLNYRACRRGCGAINPRTRTVSSLAHFYFWGLRER